MPIINESPKTRFQKSKQAVESHRNLLTHPQFDQSLDVTLAEFQDRLSRGTIDMSQAAANHFQIAGAVEFVRLLRNLSEITEPVRTPQPASLNHRA